MKKEIQDILIKNPLEYKNLSSEDKSNIEVVKFAVNKESKVLNDVPKEIKSNIDFAKWAIKNKTDNVMYLYDYIKNNDEFKNYNPKEHNQEKINDDFSKKHPTMTKVAEIILSIPDKKTVLENIKSVRKSNVSEAKNKLKI